MPAMFYPASDTIASKHPELVDQIHSIDSYLFELGGHLLRLDPAADSLDVGSGILERLLRLYEKYDVVEQVEIFICPEDGEIVEVNEEGVLWCDVCVTEYQSDECETETAYRVQASSISSPVADVPAFDRGYALLVGIGAYPHLRPLRKTTSDATALHDLLTDPVYAGYPRRNVRLLLDEGASKGAINDALDWLARQVGLEDTVVIFFSGHGAQRIGGFEPGEYLCPVEADWYNLRSTAISTDEFTAALRALGAGRVAVFLDACHSGGVGEPREADLQVQPGLSEGTYERLASGRGRVIIASCRPDEVSWELPEMDNGLFTHYLLEGLRGKAASRDGTVRVFDLFTFVSEHVPKHKDQHPLFKGELEENFAMVLATGRR